MIYVQIIKWSRDRANYTRGGYKLRLFRRHEAQFPLAGRERDALTARPALAADGADFREFEKKTSHRSRQTRFLTCSDADWELGKLYIPCPIPFRQVYNLDSKRFHIRRIQ
jgi:hypothetical protein